MPTNRLSSVLQRLLSSVGPATAGEVTDGDLLDRFVSRRDEAAFELLIWRHGPMVMGVCQRVLRNEQDAEDAFQATFLVLVRKARSISNRDSLANWLYKVAFRIACRARPRVPVFSNQSVALDEIRAPESSNEAIERDLRSHLDEELARLPEAYRRPMILCYLEGKTNDEAARLLGWPKGTVATRLTRGRERLRLRLGRRGWALSSAGLAGVLSDKAMAAALAPELVGVTLRGALAFAAGPTAAAAVVSTKAIALTEGVLRIMWYNKMKMIAGALLGIVLCGSGIGLAARSIWAADGPDGPAVGRVETVATNPPAEPLAQFQKKSTGKAQTQEIETLRNEVATLRRELETALKEINDLKTALRLPNVPPPEQGPLYRGRPAKFWLEQLKDGDPSYRKDAVMALGALAQRQKTLIPALITALKDRDYNVGHLASSALAEIGPEVVPPLLEVLKDKSAAAAHRGAIEALSSYRIDAKAAVPLLIEILKDKESKAWIPTVSALRAMGPDAKPAVPAIVVCLGRVLQIWKEKNYNLTQGSFPNQIIDALIDIDPEVRKVLPDDFIVDSKSKKMLGGGVIRAYDTDPAAWQRVYEALRKRYPLKEE